MFKLKPINKHLWVFLFVQLVQCQICQKFLKRINNKHLASHAMTSKEYKIMFPKALLISPELAERCAEAQRERNKQYIGRKRSDETRQKISEAKQRNKKPAWNKGIPRTDEQKKRTSETKRNKFKTGETTHWNTGKTTSKETRDKIRETLARTREERGFATSEESLAKRNQTLENKKEQGWIHHSTKRKGTKSTLTEEERFQKFYLSNQHMIERNEKRKKKKIQRIIDYITPFNLTLLSISDDQYKYYIKCNTCDTEFERTFSVFIPSKAHLYDGDFCPTCFPNIISYYSHQLFETNPTLKEQTGVFYVVEIEDNDSVFIKIGITNRNVKERYRGELVTIKSVLVEHTTTIFEAFSLEYHILNTIRERYISSITFGGRTECFPLHLKDMILEKFKLHFIKNI